MEMKEHDEARADAAPAVQRLEAHRFLHWANSSINAHPWGKRGLAPSSGAVLVLQLVSAARP